MSTIIKSFEAKELKKRPWAIRMADKLSMFFGSVYFLVITFIFFAAWVIINLGIVPGFPVFDRYPFVLLITTVSLEAIILTVIVLMSQNRQNYVNSLREEIDFQVNKIAEREITMVIRILVKIAEKQGIKVDGKELEEMVEDVEVSYIERKLAKQMDQKVDIRETLTKPFKKHK